MNEILTPILAQLTRGIELSADAIDAAMGELFEGRVSDVQAAAFIVALRTKGETEDELAALVRTMHRYGTPVEGRRRRDRHVRHRRRPLGHRQRLDDGRAHRGRRRRARREARQPRRVVAGRLGRRARGARRRDRARPRRCRAVRRGGRRRLLLRAALPPGDALPRPGARARSACRPRSTSSARSPTRRGSAARRSACPTPRWRRACSARCARSAPSARWCSTATTASTS